MSSARYEQIRAEGLAFVERQAAVIADATKSGAVPVDVEFRYLVLKAASAALDRDDRERDAVARNREVRATLVVAVVATLATVVQAIPIIMQLVRLERGSGATPSPERPR